MSFDNRQVTGSAAGVTTSDTVENPGWGFYVGVTGDVTVLTEGGQTVTFVAVPAGSIVPVSFTKIKATLTTATSIVRFF